MQSSRETAGVRPIFETSFLSPEHRTPIYVLPTKYGYIFVVVLLGMLWGSTNYNSSLGFVMTFLLGSMTFVSILHTHRNLRGLEFYSWAAAPVFAGETASIELLVRADRTLRPAVRMKFASGQPGSFDLQPEGDNRLEVHLTAHHRGIFKPGPLTVWTRYPFGLFRAWFELDLSAEILVYPRPADKSPALSPGWSGRSEGSRPGPGVEDFKELRAYQPGDPLQRIAWKASTRGQGLMTKEFQGQSGGAWLVSWYDLAPMDAEEKLSRLCRMVLTAHGLKQDYGLTIPGLTLGPAKGEAHLRRCLEALALYETPSPQAIVKLHDRAEH